MFSNFEAIERHLVETGERKTVVLAGAGDEIALEAVIRAHRRGIADAVLVGDEDRTRRLLEALGGDARDFAIVAADSESHAAGTAVEAVESGRADVPMKGLLQTANFLMALKFSTLCEEEALLNEATVFQYADQDRLVVAGDCAVNVAPTLAEKATITTNLVGVAQSLGADPVRVAALSVIEKATPSIPSSMEAKELAGMEWGDSVIVEGPLALDNVLDAEAARHKGIASEVAGRADVIVMPDIHAGNVFHKGVHFFGHYAYASCLLGARVPVVMNSRTDDADAKYNSILVAVLQATRRHAAGKVER
jgi:phosphate butyryltransferase